MAHRAQGFQVIKQFAHKPKVRRNANRIIKLQADQSTELTAWSALMNVKHAVDFERANWKGLIVYSAMVYDPTPRLVRRAN